MKKVIVLEVMEDDAFYASRECIIGKEFYQRNVNSFTFVNDQDKLAMCQWYHDNHGDRIEDSLAALYNGIFLLTETVVQDVE